MQDKNSIIGLIVAFIALMLYVQFVVPIISPPPDPPPPDDPEPPITREEDPVPEVTPTPPDPEPVPEPAPEPEPEDPDRPEVVEPLDEQPLKEEIRMESEMFVVKLTNRGAAIRSVRFNRDYYTYPGRDEKLQLITEIEEGVPSLTLRHIEDLGRLDEVVWEHLTPDRDPDARPVVESFRARVPELGVEVIRTYRLYDPDTPTEEGVVEPGHDIKVDITVANLTPDPVEFKYLLRSAAGIVPQPEGPRRYHEEPYRSAEQRELEISASRDVEAIAGRIRNNRVDLGTYDPGDRYEVDVAPAFLGVKNRHFAAALAPVDFGRGIIDIHFEEIGEHNVTADLETPRFDIEPGDSVTHNYFLYVGPRKPDVVAPYEEYGLEAIVHYSWPATVTRFLSWLMQALYSIVPNYGVVIILLTLLIRGALHPLTVKSQKSMHKMQKLQPLIQELKEKHKDDKQKQQQEMMQLMREQGASPLGGCLPMLIQLPVFIALFGVLRYHPGLRHAPFALWINDLSMADHMIVFRDWEMPLLGWRAINLLPFLCAGLMMAQQQMSPKSDNPQARQQQKMMMFMPLFLLFVLYTAPSGLMLYFMLSSLFGVIEQRYIKRHLEAESEAKEAAPTVPVEKKRQKRSPQRRKKRRRK